jgi:hypothetical protein
LADFVLVSSQELLASNYSCLVGTVGANYAREHRMPEQRRSCDFRNHDGRRYRNEVMAALHSDEMPLLQRAARDSVQRSLHRSRAQELYEH